MRVNEQIRAKQIRLIGADGKQIGVVNLEDAIRQAEESNLDLVEISPQTDPPVCRIMDHGKHLFQASKKKAAAKKKQRQIQVKELKFRPTIEEGDYRVKLRKLLEFLEHGDKVKVTIAFRGREVAHSELGYRLAEKLQADIADQGVFEHNAKFEGRQLIMMVAPKREQ